MVTWRYTLHISSYFLLNPIPTPTRLGVGKSPLFRNLKITTKDPIIMCFCVRQFILGAFQIREESMRPQNMDQTEIKGKLENFIEMS